MKARNSSIAIEAILMDHRLPPDELDRRASEFLAYAISAGWCQASEQSREAAEAVVTALALPPEKLAQVRRHLVRLNAWQTPPAKIS